ncbi:MAG: hypothetical protein JRF56_09430 [Deltaproteobacteria bacterium]|jgi:hypothetical protein|nr:hypothetical protein [Deltaproteobacteria bacterium]
MNERAFALLLQNKVLRIPVIVALMLAVLAPPVAAEEKPAESAWEFHVAPYLWAISMDGNVTVKGLEADADLSFSDIWDQLNFALMLAYEARKGRWGLWGNTIYAHLGGDNVSGPQGLTNIDPTVNVFWQGLGGYYRLGTWDLADAPAEKTPSVTVDTYFGARYTYLDLKLEFNGVFRDLVDDVSKSKSWVEPLLGARTIWDLSERWAVTLAGDIGGVAFGSDFAWNPFGLIGYRFNLFGDKNARVLAGYRALSQDYTDGSGRDKFKWDITMHGPILGLNIGF